MPMIRSQRGAQLTAFIVVVVLAATAAAAGHWFGIHRPPGSSKTTAASGAIAAPDTTAARIDSSGRKVLYRPDPMYPNQKFDKPGRSPFMDMELVPVYADDGGSDGAVSISPRL